MAAGVVEETLIGQAGEIAYGAGGFGVVEVEADVPAEAQAPAEPGWMDVPGIGRIQAQRGPGWAEADSYPELPGRRQLPPGQ